MQDETGPYYVHKTTAVGMYPQGQAWCGALDMSGNVWEWTLGASKSGDSIPLNSGALRVARGGGWYHNSSLAGADVQLSSFSDNRYYNFGFRVVMVVSERPPLD